MQTDHHVGFDSYDRLLPNQDSTPTGGFGNPVALPFQGDARRNKNTLFVDEAFAPYADQWRFLSSVETLSAEDLAGLLRRFGKRILGDLADANAAEAHELLYGKGSVAPEGRKDPVTPWAPKTKPGLAFGDLPDQVRIVRSNMLYVAKGGLSAAALNRLKRVAAFGNPEFYRAQAMRQSVRGKQRVLYFGEDAGDRIGLPRGCEDAVMELFASCGSQAIVEERRFEGERIKVGFNGTLRPEQKPALEALLRCDIGVLVAPTAFGKTVVAASLIAQRKRARLFSFRERRCSNNGSKSFCSFLT